MKTELIFYLFLSYLTLLVSGAPQFTTCPSDPLCLSRPVTYECNSGSNIIQWRVLDTNGDRVGTPVLYTDGGSVVGATDSIGTQFNTVLINNTNPLGANITFTPILNISSYTVQCGDATGTFVNCSIMIADAPVAARLNPPVFGRLNTVSFIQLGWVPQAVNPCLSHYIFVITSEVDNINYTTTLAYVQLPIVSINDTLYTFTVITVDTGGRTSQLPETGSYIPDAPLPVTDLMLTQTDYRTDTNDTVNITVSWNPPPESPRLLLNRYYINYNIYDVPQNITVTPVASVTNSRTLSGFTVGSVYTVGVAAGNPLGIGPTVSATITILATSTPEISSTSTSVSSFTPGINSTPSITPSSSPPSKSPLSGGAIAGIAIVALLVIAAVVISVIAIVYFVMKKNKDKQDPSVVPQNFEATNYTQVDHSMKSSSSSKRQAPPKPPKAHSPPADEVFYSAIQKSQASHAPPQEGTNYADLDPSALSSGKHHQRPKDTSQVAYSAVSHHERR